VQQLREAFPEESPPKYLVLETRADEPADGAVERSQVLIELYDVIASGAVRHHSLPGLTFPRSIHSKLKLRVQDNRLPSK